MSHLDLQEKVSQLRLAAQLHQICLDDFRKLLSSKHIDQQLIDQMGNHNGCSFGLWLSSQQNSFLQPATMKLLDSLHRLFHQLASHTLKQVTYFSTQSDVRHYLESVSEQILSIIEFEVGFIEDQRIEKFNTFQFQRFLAIGTVANY
jgi:hypothetical protein